MVSEVQITDGVVHARAITFHRVEGDRIVQQTEYWPEQYEAPAWRRPWVSKLTRKPELV